MSFVAAHCPEVVSKLFDSVSDRDTATVNSVSGGGIGKVFQLPLAADI